MKESQEKNSVLGTENKGKEELFSRFDKSLSIMKANKYDELNQEILEVCIKEFEDLLSLSKNLFQDNLNLIAEKSELQASSDLQRLENNFILVG